MAAKLRYNSDHSAFEVTVGDNSWEEDITPDDDYMVLPTDSGNPMCIILEGSQLEGVQQNTVYEMVKVTTILGPDVDNFDDEPEVN